MLKYVYYLYLNHSKTRPPLYLVSQATVRCYRRLCRGTLHSGGGAGPTAASPLCDTREDAAAARPAFPLCDSSRRLFV